MQQLDVQFFDESQERIVGYYASQQDPDVYPNMGVVEVGDVRWREYYNEFPDSMKPYIPEPVDA